MGARMTGAAVPALLALQGRRQPQIGQRRFFRNFFFLSVRFDKTAQKSTKMFNLEKTPTSNNQYARSKIPLKSDIILLKSRRKIINFSDHSTFSKIKSKNVAEMQSSSNPSPTRPHPTPTQASDTYLTRI